MWRTQAPHAAAARGRRPPWSARARPRRSQRTAERRRDSAAVMTTHHDDLLLRTARDERSRLDGSARPARRRGHRGTSRSDRSSSGPAARAPPSPAAASRRDPARTGHCGGRARSTAGAASRPARRHTPVPGVETSVRSVPTITPRRGTSPSGRRTTTGQVASLTTATPTEPSSRLTTGPRPREPSTTIEADFAASRRADRASAAVEDLVHLDLGRQLERCRLGGAEETRALRSHLLDEHAVVDAGARRASTCCPGGRRAPGRAHDARARPGRPPTPPPLAPDVDPSTPTTMLPAGNGVTSVVDIEASFGPAPSGCPRARLQTPARPTGRPSQRTRTSGPSALTGLQATTEHGRHRGPDGSGRCPR